MNKIKKISKAFLCLILIITEIFIQIPTVVNAYEGPLSYNNSSGLDYVYDTSGCIEDIVLGDMKANNLSYARIKFGKPSTALKGSPEEQFEKAKTERYNNRILWEGVSAELIGLESSNLNAWDRIKDFFSGAVKESERYKLLESMKNTWEYPVTEGDTDVDMHFINTLQSICDGDNIHIEENDEEDDHRRVIKSELGNLPHNIDGAGKVGPIEKAGISFFGTTSGIEVSFENTLEQDIIPIYAMVNRKSKHSATFIFCWYSIREERFGYLLQLVEHDWDFGWKDNTYLLLGDSSLFYDIRTVNIKGEGEDSSESRDDLDTDDWQNPDILTIIMNTLRNAKNPDIHFAVGKNTLSVKEKEVDPGRIHSILYLLDQLYTVHTIPKDDLDFMNTNGYSCNTELSANNLNARFKNIVDLPETNMEVVYLYNPKYQVELKIKWKDDNGNGANAYANLEFTVKSCRSDSFILVDRGTDNEMCETPESAIRYFESVQLGYLIETVKTISTGSGWASDLECTNTHITNRLYEYNKLSFGISEEGNAFRYTAKSDDKTDANDVTFELFNLFNNLLANTVTITPDDSESVDKSSYSYLMKELTKKENWFNSEDEISSAENDMYEAYREDVELMLKVAKAYEDSSSRNTSPDSPIDGALKNQNGIATINITNGNFMDTARLLNVEGSTTWSDVAGDVNNSAVRTVEILGPYCANQIVNNSTLECSKRFNSESVSRVLVPIVYAFAHNKVGYELKAQVEQVRLNVLTYLLADEGDLMHIQDVQELFDYIIQIATVYYGGGDYDRLLSESCVIRFDEAPASFILPYTYDSESAIDKEIFLLYFSPKYFSTDTAGNSLSSNWIELSPNISDQPNKDNSHNGLYYKVMYSLISNGIYTVKDDNGNVVDTTEILKQVESDKANNPEKPASMEINSTTTTIADLFMYDSVVSFMSENVRTPYDIFYTTYEADKGKHELSLYEKVMYSSVYYTHINNFRYAENHNSQLSSILNDDGILDFLYDYMYYGRADIYPELRNAEAEYLKSIDPSKTEDIQRDLSGVSEIEEKMMRAFNFDISVLESFEDSVNLFSTGSNTGEPLNVLRNCSRLAKYLILNVYLGNMEVAGIDENALSNYYNVDLHSFLKTSYALNDMSTYFPSSIPKMNKFFGEGDNQGIGIYMLSDEYSTMEGDNEFNALSKLANLLYCVDYAVTMCSWSDLGTEECFYNWAVLDYFLCLAEGGESNKVSGYETSKEEKGLYFALTENGQKKLEAEADNTRFKDESNGYVKFADLSKAVELSEIKTGNLVDLALSNVTIEMFRSIIELHDMCEFLGIEPTEWSYNVQKYMEVYNNHIDIFTEIRKNPLLYKNSYKGETTIEEPLGEFFSTSKDEMSDEWRRGFALSSQFVPMETNLYDAATFDFLNDDTWVNEYYYKYGFHRKALFINTDSSAIVDEHVTGDGTNFVPAKLRDLLNYDRDIILKTDSSFYNADKLEQVWDKLDYSTIKSNGDAFYQSVHNTIESIGTTGQIQDIKNGVDGVINLDAASVLKTNGVTIYSPTLATNCSTYVTDKVEENIKNSIGDALNDKYYDAYILSQDELLSGIQQYDYTIKQPFSVVSAVYRNTALYNELSAFMASDTAIFKSSKSICKVDGTYYKDWLSLYNYMMVSNLAEQIKNDAVSSLDLDAPIFIDIFGNIVTESGLVIIPAASNATLCGTSWTPLSVGFSELYYNGLFIQEDDITDDCRVWLTGTTSKKPVDKVEKVNGGGWFNLTSNGYLIRTTSVNSAGITAMIQWHTLQKNSQDIKQVFYNNAYYHTGENIYNAAVVNNVVEVLRGAPIEFIDYGKENISSQTDANVFGVYTALKLEELSNLIKKWSFTNPIFSMPSLADYPYTEYLILYSYKIAFVFFLGFFVFQIVIAGLKNKFGLSVIVDFVWSVGIIVLCVALLPALMNWSYYQSNKALLQDEMGYIMMLNYSKEFDGSEVGVTEISTPKSSTSLQLKLEDTTIDWWKLSYETLFRSTYNSITEQYTEQLRESALYGHEDVIQRSDGLFIDVNDLFDSTIISYVPSSRLFVNYTNSNDIIASYSSPYYVILDHLVAAINKYNFANNVDAYGYTVGANGHIVTYGLVEPYLVSDIFINDDYDALGLHKVLGTTSQRATYIDAFTEDDYDTMTHSYWYPETYTAEERRNFTNLIQDYAQDWVLNNLDVIGKVPDEVFIKVMALQIAVEMNSQFGIDLANSVEIKGIDTLDIMRLMVGSRGDVYKYYSYSMPRFTYQVSGQFGVILAGIYLVLTWIIGYLKPLFLIALIALLIFNVLFRKMLFSQPSKSAMGFTFTCGALMCANFLYSGMIKVSFNMVEWGMGSILSMLFGCLVQIIYLAILYVIARFIISDWRNIGAENVEQSLLSISMMGNTHSSIVTNHIKKMVPSFTGFSRKETDVTRRTPREHLDGMFKRDEERLERASMEE